MLDARDLALLDLVENSDDAILIVDTDDVLWFWNRSAERMFGHAREEVLGRHLGFLVPDELREQGELETLRRTVQVQGSLGNYVTRRLCRDGHEIPVSLTRTALHDHSGRIIGSATFLRDLTRQRRLAAQLEEARHLARLGGLAATVAHEVKNPLAGIYAAVQVLGRRLEPGDERVEVFSEITREIRHLDRLAHDLLEFARPIQLRPQQAELHGLLLDFAASIQSHPDLRPHTVVVEGAEECFARLDVGALTQVFRNLAVNAGQAMGAEPGVLRIRVRREGPRAIVTFQDEGPGVQERIRARICEPFFTTKPSGTGLGLSVARRLVEAHAGALEVPKTPGRGAEVRIVLPLSPPG